MAVVNLQPGAIFNIAANQIHGTAHVYRTNQGYPDPGNVGWLPTGGVLQSQALAVGHTVSFAINNQSGMIANGCPSKVQVLYDNGVGQVIEATDIRKTMQMFKSSNGRSAPVTAGNRSRVALNDSTAQQAMNTLNAQWYNAVVSGCHLDPSTFQLMQGNTPLGSTSQVLWNMLDTVPPQSISSYFNPSQGNVFSSDYGAVIMNLKPQNANSFQNDMGDYYSAWTNYLATSPTLPQGGIIALFSNWAMMHMPPEQAQQCITDWQQVAGGTVPAAVQLWLNAGGSTGGVKAYNATITQLQSALQSAPSASFSLNSNTASSDISHSWAQAEGGFLFDLFEIGGEGSYDHLSQTLTEAGLEINVQFQRLVTFAAGPLARPSTDPILSSYQPWYSSAALNLAYQNNNNVVWKNTPPTWDNTFGPSGNMLRTASALIVVDGISITTMSTSSISTSDQTTVKSAVEGGFWPFFEAEASGGWSHTATFDSNGIMTVSSTCPTGNPQILGVIVTPIGGLLLS